MPQPHTSIRPKGRSWIAKILEHCEFLFAAASWQFTKTHSCVLFDTQTSAVITTVSSRDTRPSSGSFKAVKVTNFGQPQLAVPFWNVLPPRSRTALAETTAAFSSSCFLAPSIVNVIVHMHLPRRIHRCEVHRNVPAGALAVVSLGIQFNTPRDAADVEVLGDVFPSFVSELQPRTGHRNVRTTSGVVSVMAGASANAPIPSRARSAQRRDPSARDWCVVTPPSRRPQTVSRTVQ